VRVQKYAIKMSTRKTKPIDDKEQRSLKEQKLDGLVSRTALLPTRKACAHARAVPLLLCRLLVLADLHPTLRLLAHPCVAQ
jgi:hypothetical protein